MFEVAEVGEKISKSEYQEQAPAVRESILDAQARLRQSDISLVIVIAGSEGVGKGDTVNFLLEWFDAREIATHAMTIAPEPHEADRPFFYRFWQRLPPRKKTAIFFGSWYTQPIVEAIKEDIDDAEFDRRMHQIVEFERMLVRENTLLLKFWLHVTKKQQKQRFKELQSDPDTAWRVTEKDWRLHKSFDRFLRAASRALRQTGSSQATWRIIESHDRRYRHLTVAKSIVSAINERLDAQEPPKEPPLPMSKPKNIINTLDLTQELPKKEYERKLAKLQARLARISRTMNATGRSAVLVFEGSDAAGKGGCIRRITHALDARFYQVIPIASPTDEELARPYLWRFWRTLPRGGHLRIYDRSWYGRVLVERIEGFCSTADWQRAYAEINQFEDQLARANSTVVKFWLSIDADEQLARFRHREQTGYKRYKLTEEDWRNREKWSAYEAAACDMIEKTSTNFAPWHLIEANDKKFARIKVLSILCDALEAGNDAVET